MMNISRLPLTLLCLLTYEISGVGCELQRYVRISTSKDNWSDRFMRLVSQRERAHDFSLNDISPFSPSPLFSCPLSREMRNARETKLNSIASRSNASFEIDYTSNNSL